MSSAALPQPAPGRLAVHPRIDAFFEPRTCSVQYVVTDPASRACALVDPVLDYDEKSGCTGTRSADALLAFVRERGLTVAWILDTHPHADHFSAAAYIKDRTGAKTGIGERDRRRPATLEGRSTICPTISARTARNGITCSRTGTSFRIGDDGGAASCSRRDTPSPPSPISSATPPSFTTRSSCRISAPPAATFPAGTRARSGARSSAFSPCRTTPACSPGTTTCPGGRAPAWESTVAGQKAHNVHLARAGPRTSSSPCDRTGTRSCRCRN